MNHNKLTLIIFFIAYPIYLDISIEEDVNLIAAIVTYIAGRFIDKILLIATIMIIHRYYSWGGGTSWNGISGFGSWWVCACGLFLQSIHWSNSRSVLQESFWRKKISRQPTLSGIMCSSWWAQELSKNLIFSMFVWRHRLGQCWFSL